MAVLKTVIWAIWPGNLFAVGGLPDAPIKT
jgi:hypothetical protein